MINKSKTYLLPLLSELVEFDKKFYKNLVNTYIYDDQGEYEKCILILHDFSFKLPEFTHYEQDLINNDLFVDFIDVGDQVLYIFKFPEEYHSEYESFQKGKYSEFGADAKELILSFFSDIYQNNLNAVDFLIKVKHVLFKNERLRKKIETDLKVRLPKDAELSAIMEVENETFELSTVKKTKTI
tara:strand:- start:8166 stop:8717 length:552 start_codon:yes stop_codon:yes gene_type:complete